MFTNLGCKHIGGGYFAQVPGTLIKKEKNWLAMLVYHYMKHHKQYLPEDVKKEAEAAITDERKIDATTAT